MQLSFCFVEGFLILGFNSQFQQPLHVFGAFFQADDGVHHFFQGSLFLTQSLSALWLVPDIRAFQLAADFL
ncbi:hypothetical protein GCM10027098_40010 [Bowmanella dokdonensis]